MAFWEGAYKASGYFEADSMFYLLSVQGPAGPIKQGDLCCRLKTFCSILEGSVGKVQKALLTFLWTVGSRKKEKLRKRFTPQALY
eukprot:619987-Pelagomonas_calceolata.AAC.1